MREKDKTKVPSVRALTNYVNALYELELINPFIYKHISL